MKPQTILCFPSSTKKSDLHPIAFSAAGCPVCIFNSHGLIWVFSEDISYAHDWHVWSAWFRCKGHVLCCCSICSAVHCTIDPSMGFFLSFGHRVTLCLQHCQRGTESAQGKSREAGQRLVPHLLAPHANQTLLILVSINSTSCAY